MHRDVKPANLLLEPTGVGRPHLWLGDLELVTPAGEPEAGGGKPLGTPGYLAPELAAGTPPDPRHDLFAVGVTAAELLTGHVTHRSRDVPRGRLRPLLTALASADPEARPPTADAALALLRGAGVPPGTPWRARSRPPVVPDRLRRVSRCCGC